MKHNTSMSYTNSLEAARVTLNLSDEQFSTVREQGHVWLPAEQVGYEYCSCGEHLEPNTYWLIPGNEGFWLKEKDYV